MEMVCNHVISNKICMFDLIVANYNNENFLVDFFESIISSTLLPNKIIFVDDCSTDKSLQIVESYIKQDKIDIVLIKNLKNMGFANSLNRAICNISSPYFARLDPDDYVSSDRFEKQLDFLTKNFDIDVLGTNCFYVLNGEIRKKSNINNDSTAVKKDIINGVLPVIHGTIMGKTGAIENFKYNQDLVPAEDYDLFAYLIYNNFNISNLKEALTFVNIHENSVSNDLKFSTIVKRYDICNNYFKVNKIFIHRYLEYKHQYFYRRYLFKDSSLKYFYLLISAVLKPVKVLKIIKSKLLKKEKKNHDKF